MHLNSFLPKLETIFFVQNISTSDMENENQHISLLANFKLQEWYNVTRTHARTNTHTHVCTYLDDFGSCCLCLKTKLPQKLTVEGRKPFRLLLETHEKLACKGSKVLKSDCQTK